MKKIGLTMLVAVAAIAAQAQKVYTKNGNVSFHSKATVESIDASSNQVMSVLVTNTGDIQFSLLVKSFHFEKALMEEHFNENYIESSKYPKATFKGKLDDLSKVSFAKDGVYAVSVTGDLNLHNVTKKITTPGTITIKGGVPTAVAAFVIKLADYGISIPAVVRKNIAETVTINVNCTYNQKL